MWSLLSPFGMYVESGYKRGTFIRLQQLQRGYNLLTYKQLIE